MLSQKEAPEHTITLGKSNIALCARRTYSLNVGDKAQRSCEAEQTNIGDNELKDRLSEIAQRLENLESILDKA